MTLVIITNIGVGTAKLMSMTFRYMWSMLKLRIHRKKSEWVTLGTLHVNLRIWPSIRTGMSCDL